MEVLMANGSGRMGDNRGYCRDGGVGGDGVNGGMEEWEIMVIQSLCRLVLLQLL